MAKGKVNRASPTEQQLGWRRVLLELVKASLSGAVRAVVAHWLG